MSEPMDLSMLSWCAGEIRQALELSEEHLSQHLGGDGDDSSMLSSARSSLHQAHGALGMVDLAGTTQVTAEAEVLLARVQDGELEFTAEVSSKISAAFSAINEYMDELLRGDPEQPLRLFPYLKDLLQLRGADRIHPADLFFPTLLRLPAPSGEPVSLSVEEYGAIRAQFESGLLGALRSTDDMASVAQMARAIDAFQGSALAASNHTFWQVSNAFFCGLKNQQVKLDGYGKRLLARINLQLRRTLQDGSPVADRLLRDTLFSIACSSPDAEELKPIIEKFGLAGMVPPDFESPRYWKVDRRAMIAANEAIAEMKKTWETMLAQPGGVAEHLGQFKQGLSHFRNAADELSVEGLDRLTSGWISVVKTLGLDSGPVSDAVGVEVATSLLFVEQLFAFGLKEFEDLPGRCDELSRRIDATLHEVDAPDDAPVWLRELTASVQERLTLAAFTAETQSGLREAESILDNYFRDPSKGRESLNIAFKHFGQISGVLKMQGYDAASEASQYLADQTDGMAQGADVDTTQLAVMAGSVGTLGFFLDAIKSNRRSLSDFVFDAQTGVFEQAHVGSNAVAADDAAKLGDSASQVDLPVVEASEESAETLLEQRQIRLDEALTQWAEAPDEINCQLAVSELLQNICDSAQLVDAADLLASAQASIELANSGRQAAAVEIAVKLGRPAALCALQLPEAIVADLPEAEEDVDEELLEIFLAEAIEVLEAVGQAQVQLEQAPADEMALTKVRRGFHTLKGSSRMVGLDSFGEAAWPLEQVFNAWLAEEKRADPDLLRLIAQAREVFGQWVASLEPDGGRTLRPDPRVLVARAEAMREGGSFDSIPDALASTAPAVPGDITIVDTDGTDDLTSLLTADDEEPLNPTIESLEVVEPVELAEVAQTAEAVGSMAIDSNAIDAIGFDFDLSEPAESETVNLHSDAAIEALYPESAPAEPEIIDWSVLSPEASVTSVNADLESSSIAGIDFTDRGLGNAGGSDLLGSAPHIADEFAQLDEQLTDAELDQPASQGDQGLVTPVVIGDNEVSRPLFQIFVEESRQLEKILVPDAQAWCEDYSRKGSEAARRAVHSLKGSAALVNVEPVRTLAGLLEQFLAIQISLPRNTSADDTKEYARLIDVMFVALAQFSAEQEPAAQPESIAAAQALLNTWQGYSKAPAAVIKAAPVVSDFERHDEHELPAIQDEFDEELLPLFIEEAEEYLPQIDESLRAWLQSPGDAKLQQLIMRQFHTVKGSARMAGAMVLGQRVHDMETRVESAMALKEVPTQIIEDLLAEQDIVSEQFEYIRDPSMKPEVAPGPSGGVSTSSGAESGLDGAVALAPVPASRTSVDTDTTRSAQTTTVVRVRSEVLDKLVNEAGEVSIARSRLDNSVVGLRSVMNELAENVNRLRSYVRELEMQGEMRIQASSEASEQTNPDFDPLEFDRFTRFQELTRMMAESVNDVGTVQANATRAIEDAVGDLGRQGQTLRQLQHNLMGIRMVQFGTVNDRLYRVVRQAAKSLGKRVSLDIRGATVQLDRGVLEKMVAPLEHLLRNAVSHGIEEPEQRLASGKRETGDIRITVAQDGNEIVIILSDDGGGLNLTRIRERGIERSLISEQDSPSKSRLSDLIFMPGFSTAKGVDQISGRGVGMDVVRSEVALLSGRVQVESDEGQGTRFVVHLPLTMAIEQVMLISVGKRNYAVPSANVEQVLQLDPERLASAYAERVVLWQDERVPLYSCGSLVHAEGHKMLAQHLSPVMILRSGGRRVAVHADEVSKSQEVMVKNVGLQVAKVNGVAGATLMGNGEVVLILNLGQLAAQMTESEQDEAMRAGLAAGLADAPPTVMVVDDSVTVRKVTQRFLVRESFDVLLAKDGVDALRQLEERIPDVMLVDVEMPRMDGFDLTRALRRDPRFRAIPILMITSRTADKHRNFAISLGVNEYLGKPYDETKLLAMVQDYVARKRAKKVH